MGKTTKYKQLISIMCIVITIICSVCGCSSGQMENVPDDTAGMEEIIIGSDNYPPFNYTDMDGQPTGIDVELAKEAFYRLGYKAVFVSIDWEDKKKLLKNGEIDCLWGSFSMNGREDEYKWAGPYMLSRQVIAVSNESNIYNIGDLEDKVIAVQTTTKPEEIFTKRTDVRIPQVGEIFSLQNRELIYPFLSKGYVDAIAAHETAIIQYMKDYNIEFRILSEPLATVGLGVAFDKNDERGIDTQLSMVLMEMGEDGTIKQIVSKYLEDADKYLEGYGYDK